MKIATLDLSGRGILTGAHWFCVGTTAATADAAFVGATEALALSTALASVRDISANGAPWVQVCDLRGLLAARVCTLGILEGPRELACELCGEKTRTLVAPMRGNWVAPLCAACRPETKIIVPGGSA